MDENGFEWLRHTSQINVLDPNFDIMSYMNEMAAFLRERYECQEVFIYDYVRRSPNKLDQESGYSDVTRRVHCGKIRTLVLLLFSSSITLAVNSTQTLVLVLSSVSA